LELLSAGLLSEVALSDLLSALLPELELVLALDVLRLSVTYQPEPLKTTAEACGTRRTFPLHSGQRVRGFSVNF
jgi:hypothetical protein